MNMGMRDCAPMVRVDVPRIDRQHQEIFDLAASFAGGGDHVRVMKSLAALSEHVRTHFREEEHLMASCGYPGLAAHRRQHQECRRMLVELLDQARTMNLDEIAEAVRQLVDGWIYNHILTADFDYVPFVRDALMGAPAQD